MASQMSRGETGAGAERNPKRDPGGGRSGWEGPAAFQLGNQMSCELHQTLFIGQSHPLITFPASFVTLSVGRRTDKGR